MSVDREALADWLGARPEAYNVTDPSDEQTTFIEIGVEELTNALVNFIDQALADDEGLRRRMRQAVLDPGSFVHRGEDHDGTPYGEDLGRWQDRALEAALTDTAEPEDPPGRELPATRCQYVSPSPWGPSQCTEPIDHEPPHLFSPSEAIQP